MDDDIAKEIGHNIRTARVAKALTQEQLADALGVDQTTVSAWELGHTTPPHKRIPAIAAALGVDPTDLLPYGRVA